MRHFDLTPLSPTFRTEVLKRLDNLAKPKGSLGRLEEIALQVCLIKETTLPRIQHPHHLLFSADHGIETEGVSKTPKCVTWQQTLNFQKQGTAIAFLCRQHGIELSVIDAGVDYDFPPDSGIIDCKIRKGTHNYLHEAAMSQTECQLAIERGAEQVDRVYAQGCDLISFGEMGVANTSSSALWAHLFTDHPLAKCVGAGSGLDDAGIQHKLTILQQALEKYPGTPAPLEVMSYFGGFEMVMAVGAMLRAAELRLPILIDGFIMTACLLAASQLHPTILEYAIYGHEGDEQGHALLLQYLRAKPILQLGMRLGEGTGALVAYPIVQSATLMMTEMHTWKGIDQESKNVIQKYF